MSRGRACRGEPVACALLCGLLACTLTRAQSIAPAAPGLRTDAPVDANRPYAQELDSSAAPDLVIAMAGSLSIDTLDATLPSWDPRVIELLTGQAFPSTTTVAVADLQTTLIQPTEFAGYPYPWDGARAYAAPAAIAPELRRRGLRMLGRANSHALDWGIDGMHATDAALDAAGIKHAGTGEREGLARSASFLEQPGGKGRIALLATATGFRPTTNALSARGAAPGRPGISGMELTPLRLVPAPERGQLQRIACRLQYPDDPGHCEHLPALPADVALFGSRFQSGTSPGEDYTSNFEVNRVQVGNELRAIREAKQNSDLLVFSIATGRLDLADAGSNARPTVLERLAHAAIDGGADLVNATGPASIGPIEIYRSATGAPRPILYGLGQLYLSPGLAAASARTDAQDALIVRSSFDGRRLTLEIYPIDLGAADGAIGVPRLAAAARGRSILERVQRLSSRFHTELRTEAYGPTVRGVIVAERSDNPPEGAVP